MGLLNARHKGISFTSSGLKSLDKNPGCAPSSLRTCRAVCLGTAEPGESALENLSSPTETQFQPPSHLEQPGEVNKGCSFHRASSFPLLFPEQFPDEAAAALSIPKPGPAPSFLLRFVVLWVNTEQNLNFNLLVPLWQLLKGLTPKLRGFGHGEGEGIKKAEVAEVLFGLGNSALDQRAAQPRAASCPHNGQPQPGRKAWEGGRGQLWNPQSPGEAGATAGSPRTPPLWPL